MGNKLRLVTRLIFGLFLFGLGTVLTLNAKIGVAPWDVFHQGVSKVTGITVGRANIYTGFVVILLDIILKQDIGWATICNMILVGTFIDILIFSNLIPVFDGFLPSLIMLLLGITVQGYGCYIYISAGLGAGPRDGLMVVLTKKTGKSVRLIKSIIEVSIVTLGYILGGNFGIGTVIMAVFSGHIWQMVFSIFDFNVADVKHRFLRDDIQYLSKRFKKIKKENL